ncbi:MAG: 30S ribosomal protein S1 [Bryobacteraceae bacterium]
MTFPKSPLYSEAQELPMGEMPADETPVDSSFGDILSQFEQEHRGTRSETLQGVIVSFDAESAFVDIGRKNDGVIPIASVRDDQGELLVKVGDKIVVTITGRDQEGNYQLSTIKVERPKDWSALESAFEEKRVIAGIVKESVKGGFRVDVGMTAFMPASRSGTRDQAEMDKLVGQEIECRVIKLDKEKDDIVVDRRSVLEEQRMRAKGEAFAAIQEGAVITGTVRSVTDFGAFVDLGGLDGLLHVTDLAWNRVAKPSDVLQVGQQIEVKVLKVNAETKKISLGRKQLLPDPWSVAAEKYIQGERLKGTVTRLTDFGAFVELEPGIEGLIHISEMSWTKKIRRPSDVLKAGELVEAVILGVNPADRRISLGLKQALGDPWADAKAKFVKDAIFEVPVTSLQKFGVFVDLGDGLEGMIHIGDISREKRLEHPSEMLKVGQVVRAQVLELDETRRRVRLGMKQLEPIPPSSADEYIAEHKVGDKVTGRIVDASSARAKVQLDEGVSGYCALGGGAAQASKAAAAADLSSMTALLTAKWKGGGGGSSEPEPIKAGQIRSFKISGLDAAQKKIDLELAD